MGTALGGDDDSVAHVAMPRNAHLPGKDGVLSDFGGTGQPNLRA